MQNAPERAEVVVVGAGPAGSATAYWAARAGFDVLLVDRAAFPRDKTCGDGLTPRAVTELDRMGLRLWLREHHTNQGLRLHGFGHQHELHWPTGSFATIGSAVPRTELDAHLREYALAAGARTLTGQAVDVERDGERVTAVLVETDDGPVRVGCERLVVADGVRSTLGRVLGRRWHRRSVYGVAARAYAATPRSDDPWITSHLELHAPSGELTPGYGWIFPLGDGRANVGCGSLATEQRQPGVALKPLLAHYVSTVGDGWDFAEPERFASAALPMGGAVTGIAGPNWAMVGDAAACVNPLNGEGIDYALEGGRLLAPLLDAGELTDLWPALLRARFGGAFTAARLLGQLATRPTALRLGGKAAMSSGRLMGLAVRVMGNLVDDDDRDVLARLWHLAGRGAVRVDPRPLFGPA